MRSAGLLEWICKNPADVNCEFAHGWWNSAEFLQLLSNDFEDFDFDVITSFSMDTPPPTSIITMPVISARRMNLEIVFKESWVLEPNYTVTVKWDFPSEYLYEPYREGATTFSGSVKNQHLLYSLFHILSFQAKTPAPQAQ